MHHVTEGMDSGYWFKRFCNNCILTVTISILGQNGRTESTTSRVGMTTGCLVLMVTNYWGSRWCCIWLSWYSEVYIKVVLYKSFRSTLLTYKAFMAFQNTLLILLRFVLRMLHNKRGNRGSHVKIVRKLQSKWRLYLIVIGLHTRFTTLSEKFDNEN